MNIRIVSMIRGLVEMLAQNYGQPVTFKMLVAAMRLLLVVEDKLED